MISTLLLAALTAGPAEPGGDDVRFEMTVDGFSGSAESWGAEIGLGFRGEHLGLRTFFGGGAVRGEETGGGGLAVTLGTGGAGSRLELDLGVGGQYFSRDEEAEEVGSALAALGLPSVTHSVSGSAATLPFLQVRAGAAWPFSGGAGWFRLGVYVKMMERREVLFTEQTCTYVFWMGSCSDEAKTVRYGGTSAGVYVSFGSSHRYDAARRAPVVVTPTEPAIPEEAVAHDEPVDGSNARGAAPTPTDPPLDRPAAGPQDREDPRPPL